MTIPLEKSLRKLKLSMNKFNTRMESCELFLQNFVCDEMVDVSGAIDDVNSKVSELEDAYNRVSASKEDYFSALEESNSDQLSDEFIKEEMEKWDKEECNIDRECVLTVDKMRSAIVKFKNRQKEHTEASEAMNNDFKLKQLNLEMEKLKLNKSENHHASIKLAGFEPPRWDGSPRRFNYWKNGFIETIAAANIKQDMIKVHWLRNSIPEEWRRCIIGCETIEMVWEKLKIALPLERIVQDIEMEFRKIKPVKTRDRDEILNFINNVEDYCQQMVSVGCSERIQDLVFINDILRKLPTDFQTSMRTSLRILNETRESNGLPPISQSKERVINELRDLSATYSGSNSERFRGQRNTDHNNIKQSWRIHAIARPTDNDKSRVQLNDNDTRLCGRIQCRHRHRLEDCFAFKRLNVKERFTYVKENRFCFSCLDRSHRRSDSCPTCSECEGNHHKLLCRKNDSRNVTTRTTYSKKRDEQEANNNSVVMNSSIPQSDSTMLPILLVNVRSEGGQKKWLKARCLIDGGSDTSLIRQEFAQRLGIEGTKVNLTYGVVGGRQQREQSTELEIEIRDSTLQNGGKVVVYSIKKICEDSSPLNDQFFEENAYLEKIKDKVDGSGGPIDLLIGRDVQAFVKEVETIPLPRYEYIERRNPHAPIGIKYPLGWAITGKQISPHDCSTRKINRIITVDINSEETVEDMKRFFISDVSGVYPTEKCVCKDAEIIESNFIKSAKENTRIDDDGRVEIALPWKDGYPLGLPCNYKEAEADLYRQRNFLNKSGEYDLYKNEMEKLLASEFVEPVEIKDEPAYYISHHHVIRPENESTPVRTVWNSAKKNSFGFCMNDALHKGPDLLNQIFKCIIGFRENTIAFIGDIRKMFNMVSIRKEDRQFHRFLWWNEDGTIQAYQ